MEIIYAEGWKHKTKTKTNKKQNKTNKRKNNSDMYTQRERKMLLDLNKNLEIWITQRED